MTELSPAAQAVLDVVRSAYWSDEAMAPNDAEVIAAAVLRAAADRTMDLVGDVCHPKYAEGIEAASNLLERIASELEAL